MATYRGQPVDMSERPALRCSSLGPSCYRIGNTRYTVTDNSVSLFRLEERQRQQEEGMAQEISLPAAPTAAAAPDDAPSSAAGRLVPPLLHWVTRTGGETHPSAVRSSIDADGGPLYVGRAYLLGDLLPGKVAERHRVCYVALGGREYGMARYEVLVLEKGAVEWVTAKDGLVPPCALATGLTADGRKIYTARAVCSGVVTPGLLVSGDTVARISYDLKEFTFSGYEVLTVRAQTVQEASASAGARAYADLQGVQYSTSESDQSD